MQHMCTVSCKQQDYASQVSFQIAVHRSEEPMLGSHAVTILNFMGGFHCGHL